MRILITGASGLLGSTIALQASEIHSVVGVVNRQMIASDQFEVVQQRINDNGGQDQKNKHRQERQNFFTDE